MIRINGIKIDISKDNTQILKEKCQKKLKIKKQDILELNIIRRSIDARNKPDIYYNYMVDIKVNNENKILNKNKNKDISKAPNMEYKVEISGHNKMKHRPIIVGTGPSGLIASYMLAQYGYKPIIIERGKDIDERIKDVEEFWSGGELKENSNIQFGLGGAGTFSDGKLSSTIKDKNNRKRKVFEIFIENGANKEILYDNMPHIGTDNLINIMKNMKNKIIEYGGEFKFNSLVTDLIIENKKIKGIIINNKNLITCDILIMGIGHSARDTFKMLYNKGVNMTSKPFAVGIRIQHSQETINKNQYGTPQHNILKNASYKLTYKSKTGRGVYTFCMCPGGYVINASSSQGKLVVNGMSNYNRDSGNANSAVVVTVDKNDYGENIFDGMNFQEKLEQKAYDIGKGSIPISLYGDYVKNRTSKNYKDILPIFKGSYKFTNIRQIFPNEINEALIEGINNFENYIKGYANENAIIAGVESRTSSPIRIIRDANGEANYKGLYPIGEGAGYAGGITSSGIDGLIAFEKIIQKYKNNK